MRTPNDVPHSEQMTPRIKQLKSTLRAEAERLERELTSIATRDPEARGTWNVRPPGGTDASAASSHAEASEEADMNEEIETNAAEVRALAERLAEVKRALVRMDEGSYGRCALCGAPIPIERLLANPAAEYDMEHQPRE